MAGYSGTPLETKLGLKAGQRVLLLDAPPDYDGLFVEKPAVQPVAEGEQAELIHWFVNDRAEFERLLPELKTRLTPAGALWVSWYKKAARRPTELTEDLVRAAALAIGLVDVKVCAVDESWSGLKLVIPVKNRR